MSVGVSEYNLYISAGFCYVLQIKLLFNINTNTVIAKLEFESFSTAELELNILVQLFPIIIGFVERAVLTFITFLLFLSVFFVFLWLLRGSSGNTIRRMAWVLMMLVGVRSVGYLGFCLLITVVL